MPKDTILPTTDHGIASFQRHTFGNPVEPMFNDGGGKTTNITIPAGQNLALRTVIAKDGTPAENGTVGKEAFGILAAAVNTSGGSAAVAPVYRDGSWSMGALTFDASYATDADKAAAFEDGASPTIFVERREYASADIPAL